MMLKEYVIKRALFALFNVVTAVIPRDFMHYIHTLHTNIPFHPQPQCGCNIFDRSSRACDHMTIMTQNKTLNTLSHPYNSHQTSGLE